MKIYCKGDLIYTLVTNQTLSVDEALDIVAPYDWREQVNEFGFFMDTEVYDGGIWYDDLEVE